MMRTRCATAARAGRMLAAGLAMAATQCWAGCSIDVTPVAFGTYNPFSNSNQDGLGSVAVLCDVSYTITLSMGAGTYVTRKMTSGANSLDYNLYTNLARTIVWGDGTGGSSTVGGNASFTTQSWPVYGRIPARQNVVVGNYSDSIVVTVTF